MSHKSEHCENTVQDRLFTFIWLRWHNFTETFTLVLCFLRCSAVDLPSSIRVFALFPFFSFANWLCHSQEGKLLLIEGCIMPLKEDAPYSRKLRPNSQSDFAILNVKVLMMLLKTKSHILWELRSEFWENLLHEWLSHFLEAVQLSAIQNCSSLISELSLLG